MRDYPHHRHASRVQATLDFARTSGDCQDINLYTTQLREIESSMEYKFETAIMAASAVR